jgi:hypothetical protein
VDRFSFHLKPPPPLGRRGGDRERDRWRGESGMLWWCGLVEARQTKLESLEGLEVR